MPVEEEAAKTAHDELTTAPISQLPLPLRLSKSGLKLSLGRREGWVKVALRFGLISPYYTDLICNKLN